jgi:hypothetical protein
MGRAKEYRQSSVTSLPQKKNRPEERFSFTLEGS